MQQDAEQATYSARLEANGRIVIPARVREALGLVAGSELSLTVDGDALVVRSRRATVRRVREQLRERLRRRQPGDAPPEEGGVERFLSERRAAERHRDSRLDRLLGDRPDTP